MNRRSFLTLGIRSAIAGIALYTGLASIELKPATDKLYAQFLIASVISSGISQINAVRSTSFLETKTVKPKIEKAAAIANIRASTLESVRNILEKYA